LNRAGISSRIQYRYWSDGLDVLVKRGETVDPGCNEGEIMIKY